MYGEDCKKIADLSKRKVDFLNNNNKGYMISSMLAGIFVGFGIMLAFTVGGVLNSANSPFVKVVMGISFSVALALVVFAGGELFTGNNLVMTCGYLYKKVTIKDTLKIWGFSYIGNFLGSVLGALLYYLSGLWRGVSGEYMVSSAINKINVVPSELFIRGILCNMLVCLALWCTLKMKEESGKILMITLCIYVFVAVGFEHSVANMTLLTIGYLLPIGGVTLGGIVYNLLFVTLGNLVGGVFFIAFPFYMISKNKINY